MGKEGCREVSGTTLTQILDIQDMGSIPAITVPMDEASGAGGILDPVLYTTHQEALTTQPEDLEVSSVGELRIKYKQL